MGLVPATGWELAIQLAKLLEYLGIASLAGGTVCLLFYQDGRRRTIASTAGYIGFCCLLGFSGALLAFLFQVGMTSGSGLAGMFDPAMARLLLSFEIGDATLLRLAGFLAPAAACAVFAGGIGKGPPTRAQLRTLGAVNTLSLLPLLASFVVTGHIAVLGLVAKASIVLHLLAISVWVGAFFPLLLLCWNGGGDSLATTMRGFGDMAACCLLLLFAAGLILLLEVFQTPAQLVSTSYGATLLIKLSLVGLLLLIAAGNRFILVPRMLAGAGPANLSMAITAEMIVALAILIVTSYLATTVGPPSMPM